MPPKPEVTSPFFAPAKSADDAMVDKIFESLQRIAAKRRKAQANAMQSVKPATVIFTIKVTEAPTPDNYVDIFRELQDFITTLNDDCEDESLGDHIRAMKTVAARIDMSIVPQEQREDVAAGAYDMIMSLSQIDLSRPETLATWKAKFSTQDDADDLRDAMQRRGRRSLASFSS